MSQSVTLSFALTQCHRLCHESIATDDLEDAMSLHLEELTITDTTGDNFAVQDIEGDTVLELPKHLVRNAEEPFCAPLRYHIM